MTDWPPEDAEETPRRPYWGWWRPALAVACLGLCCGPGLLLGSGGTGLGLGLVLAAACFLPVAVLEAIGAVFAVLSLFG